MELNEMFIDTSSDDPIISELDTDISCLESRHLISEDKSVILAYFDRSLCPMIDFFWYKSFEGDLEATKPWFLIWYQLGTSQNKPF